jgi:hypothetical protein
MQHAKIILLLPLNPSSQLNFAFALLAYGTINAVVPNFHSLKLLLDFQFNH